MAVIFTVSRGSGRATCRVCRKKIKIGVLQVNAFGFRSSGRAHLQCLNKAGFRARRCK
jgi:hypothetical protein